MHCETRSPRARACERREQESFEVKLYVFQLGAGASASTTTVELFNPIQMCDGLGQFNLIFRKTEEKDTVETFLTHPVQSATV